MLHEYTFVQALYCIAVLCFVYQQMGIIITCQFPAAANRSAQSAVFQQFDIDGRLDFGRGILAVVDELVRPDNVCPLNLGKRFAGITVRSHNRPGVLIHEHLMHPHLMGFPAHRESGMEEIEQLALLLVIIN
ncbi:hypothetical protein D3C80_1447340 [compost metagenome]